MDVEELLKRYAAGQRDFTAANLIEANLRGVNLSGANLSRANLSVANLSGANLSQANLSRAQLNVARLSGANLSQANLSGANLNVANLSRADLRGAELVQAVLIKAELVRANLSEANLMSANLSKAVLREAQLRYADLSGANLVDTDLREASLLAANLEQANLRGADLSRADLSGADLKGAELKQINFNNTNFCGADLSGANLRWADLSGADLTWADLSEAKLSGANLSRANLSNANLWNTILVHADLTQANLIKADWAGADLTGANLTGSKLHAVSRFGLKSEGIVCEWVDLSPMGDRSQIYQFTPETAKKFFNQTPPTVQISLDAPLDQDASFALSAAYYQVAQKYSIIKSPPSLDVGHRRTILRFKLDDDNQLFPIAYVAILPFQDVSIIQENIRALMQLVQSQDIDDFSIRQPDRLQQLNVAINQVIDQVSDIQFSDKTLSKIDQLKFFRSPTQVVLINSSGQTLPVYQHPMFGKHWYNSPDVTAPIARTSVKEKAFVLPSMRAIVDFVKSFTSWEK